MQYSALPGKNLEDRTTAFALSIRRFVRKLPRTITNIEDVKQLVRSSGSIGANYIEANESLGKDDFKMRMRIARKEAKESLFWLKMLDIGTEQQLLETHQSLTRECMEIRSILSSIILKVSPQKKNRPE